MILEAIWHGNFTPEDLIDPMEQGYRKARQKVCNLMDELKKEIPDESYRKVEQLASAIYSAECMECQAYFEIGFAAGIELEWEIREKLECLE